MAENSKIEWTHHTFNPWVGCTKVSPGCDHCYAEGWAKRGGQVGWGPGQRKRTSAANWQKPVKWDAAAKAAGERHRVFCASLADVFDNDRAITSGWRGDLWHLIARTPNLDWLLLTKRPQNIAKMLPDQYGAPPWGNGWPNVWLGTTVENQDEADRRIPHLLAVPAAVRFLSCEPLLGQVNLAAIAVQELADRKHAINALDGIERYKGADGFGYAVRNCISHSRGVDWVICGGESGPKARPMHPDWARSLRDQCQAAGVAFHFKQWGEWVPIDGPNANGCFTRDWPAGERPEAKLEYIDRLGKRHDRRSSWRRSIYHDYLLARLGKARAGRLLDGREWNEFPTPARAA